MKQVIKWVSVAIAGLLALTVAFTAVFLVLPLSRSFKNLQEKRNEPSSVTQAAESAAASAPPAEETTAPQPEATTAADASGEQFTEYDIYRTGQFYVKGTVTDKDGETNPMELAITDGSVYMLTAVSGVTMGVMIGGGKTYLVSPQNKMYIEMSAMVMSVLGMDSSKLAAPTNFNFSDMRPLSEADAVEDAELNGTPCRKYAFHAAGGRETYVYMEGTRLLETDIYNADGSLYNRMTFETVSGEIPADRVAPPTYYNKVGLLKFISTVGSQLSE